jgi:6-phosphogluconolactonase (cycloisomerase 2 family)
VLNELDSTLTTYAWEAETGGLRPQQVITTLPTDFTGNSTASEIAVSADGKVVYATNRGHDSVAIFAAQPNGLLSPVGWEPSQGQVPRFAALAPGGRFFYAANEQGDNIVTFRVDPRTGRLATTGQVVANASPVSIVFAGG